MDYGPHLLFVIAIVFCSLLTGIVFLMIGNAVQGILSLSCAAALIFLCAYARKRNQ